MRLLNLIESVLFRSKTISKEVKIELKEILCKRKKKILLKNSGPQLLALSTATLTERGVRMPCKR
jgi:hypothetical protein